MITAVYTGHAPVSGNCLLLACSTEIQSADVAEWRKKQCSILSVAARRWLDRDMMSLGN
jgi:hypothetical protein